MLVKVINKLLFYLYMLLMLVTFNEGILQQKWAYFSDEVLLCISTLILFHNFFKLRKTVFGRPLVNLILIYFIVQLVNFVFSPYDLKFVFTFGQALINLKALLVPLAILLLYDQVKPTRRFVRNYLILLIVLFSIGLLLNIILQSEWNSMLGWKTEYRYGFLRMAGWFGGTHYLGYFLTLVSLVVWMGIVLKRKGRLTKRFYLSYSVFQFVLSFPLTIRKGLLSIVSLMYHNFSTGSKTKIIRLGIVSLFVVFGVYLFLGESSYFSDTKLDILRMTNNDDDNYYIRGLMIYNGTSLAVSHFPFGTGAATFGTVLSKYNTLEVYQKVSIPSFWYEGEELSGVYDSGFFSLLAENGFVGIVVMILVMIYFSKYLAARVNANGKGILDVLAITMVLWSVTEPVIQNGIFTVIYTTLIVYVVSKYKVSQSMGEV
jgi:hypothetical protein